MILAVFRRRRYCVKALPLRCNRIAVTVQSRRDYTQEPEDVSAYQGVIASPLRCNRDAITP